MLPKDEFNSTIMDVNKHFQECTKLWNRFFFLFLEQIFIHCTKMAMSVAMPFGFVDFGWFTIIRFDIISMKLIRDVGEIMVE